MLIYVYTGCIDATTDAGMFARCHDGLVRPRSRSGVSLGVSPARSVFSLSRLNAFTVQTLVSERCFPSSTEARARSGGCRRTYNHGAVVARAQEEG